MRSDPGDTRTLQPQTRPPPAGRLPCQVQLSRPKQIPADKDTAFEPEPCPRWDQISRQRRKKIPAFSPSQTPAAAAPRRGAAWRPRAPLPPRLAPLNHASDHRHGDRRLLRFGFQSREAAASGRQAGAPTPGPDGPMGASVVGILGPPSLMRYPT